MKKLLTKTNLILTGDTSQLYGYVTGLRGDVTGLCGYVDRCELTDAERRPEWILRAWSKLHDLLQRRRRPVLRVGPSRHW